MRRYATYFYTHEDDDVLAFSGRGFCLTELGAVRTTMARVFEGVHPLLNGPYRKALIVDRHTQVPAYTVLPGPEGLPALHYGSCGFKALEQRLRRVK